ncbi:MAG: major capsid protein [Hyphomicrobiales bacterium]|nr:major capsid protein [Hyphomicrobiales bacterium]
MTMNIRQARVIDPILTTVVQGYKNAKCVGNVLFPRVPVPVRGGTVLEFGREAFRLANSRRSPGADTTMISFGYEGKPYALKNDALDAPLPRELQQDAQSVPHIDLGQRAINIVLQKLSLGLEYEQAQYASDPANYGDKNKEALAGSDQWSDPACDPAAIIDAAKEQVRQSAGVDPNRMVIGKPTFNVLKRHPKIKDNFKYTSSDSITADMLAAYFDLDTVAVGAAAILDGPEDGAKFVDVWGNNAVLAYTPDDPSGFEEPSYGYTYTLEGHPFAEQPYWMGQRKSWIYGAVDERAPVLTGIASGFLLQNVIAG